MDDAVRIAENIPVGKFGSIEVQPEMRDWVESAALGIERRHREAWPCS